MNTFTKTIDLSNDSLIKYKLIKKAPIKELLIKICKTKQILHSSDMEQQLINPYIDLIHLQFVSVHHQMAHQIHYLALAFFALFFSFYTLSYLSNNIRLLYFFKGIIDLDQKN